MSRGQGCIFIGIKLEGNRRKGGQKAKEPLGAATEACLASRRRGKLEGSWLEGEQENRGQKETGPRCWMSRSNKGRHMGREGQ